MITILVALIWLHLLSDFVLQTNWMALNKSKRNDALLLHVAVYILPFVSLAMFFDSGLVVTFCLVNALLHFITDYYTSRVSSSFFKNDKRHLFFITIGVDQAIHQTTLLLTAKLFLL